MKCVNCGEEATKGSLTHPYCEDCWNKLWEGNEKQYEKWLLVHNSVEGMLWYKKNILKQKLNLYDRFLLFFVGKTKMKKETVGDIGAIGVVMGLIITVIGLIYGLSLGLTDSEIIDKMSIGLIVFLGGMTLVLYCQVKKSNEFFRKF